MDCIVHVTLTKHNVFINEATLNSIIKLRPTSEIEHFPNATNVVSAVKYTHTPLHCSSKTQQHDLNL
jgi:hypothetical protein